MKKRDALTCVACRRDESGKEATQDLLTTLELSYNEASASP